MARQKTPRVVTPRIKKLNPEAQANYNSKVQERYNRLAPRMETRSRQSYLKRFAADMGLSSSRGASGATSTKMGLTGQALAAGTSGSAQPATVPTMGSPTSVSEVSNPSINSIAESLEQLLTVVNKIAITENKRQKTMLSNMVTTNRTTLENQREALNTTSGNTMVANGTQTSLTSIDKPIQELIKKFEQLSDTLDDKLQEDDTGDGDNTTFMERFMDDMGMGDIYDANKKGQSKARREFTRGLPDDQLLDKDGKKLTGNDKAKRITELYDEKRKAPKAAMKPGTTSGKVTEVIKSGMNKVKTVAGGAGSGVKTAIKKAAGPLITKSIGKTAVKSIPLVGAAAGVGFAIGKLLKGDVVGAGLEASSGLAGPLSAIPLMVATVARDIYSDVYGVQPEQDPELMKRMPVVKETIEEIVKGELKGSVEPKQKPSATDIDKATVPANPPTPPTPQATQTNAPPITPSSPPGLPPPIGGPPSTPAAPGSPEYFTGKEPGSSTGGNSTASPSSGLGSPSMTNTNTSTASTATSMQDSAMTSAEALSPQVSTGTSIMTATEQTNAPPTQYSNMMGFDPGQNMFRPQRTPTSSGGRAGIGNVPAPDYSPSGKNNLGEMFKLMFFNLNYQEQ